MKISVLLTGSELLDGRVGDTNARWIGQKLAEQGLYLHEVMICSDDEAHIVRSLTQLADHSDIVIISGGLGPTSDDRTREAVASFFSVPLELDSAVLERLQKLYETRKRVFTENSRKQAARPQGASLIDNEWGTASCFEMTSTTARGTQLTIIALPGVPSELTKLCEVKVFPGLFARIAKKFHTHSFSTFGEGEAAIGATIESLELDPCIEVAYRAAIPEVHIKLRGLDAAVVDTAAQKVRLALSKIIFSEVPNEFLPQGVAKMVIDGGHQLAIVESVTGGAMTVAVKELLGASFAASAVLPQPPPSSYLRDVMKNSSATVGVEVKFGDVVGGKTMVEIVVITSAGENHHTVELFGSFERVKNFAVHHALDTLRKVLVPPV